MLLYLTGDPRATERRPKRKHCVTDEHLHQYQNPGLSVSVMTRKCPRNRIYLRIIVDLSH